MAKSYESNVQPWVRWTRVQRSLTMMFYMYQEELGGPIYGYLETGGFPTRCLIQRSQKHAGSNQIPPSQSRSTLHSSLPRFP